MLNQLSFEAVRQSSFDSIFCAPLYDSYCFAHLPQTFKNLLLDNKGKGLPADVLTHPTEKYDCLVVLLIDGFGWRFLKKYLNELPFLKRFLDEGVVSQITSQFPSTTVAHLTCLNTGLSVGQSGLYEWYYYEPLVKAVISPFRFTLAGEANLSLHQQADTDPATLFPFPSFYEDLKQEGVPSTVFYHRSYAFSPYSQITARGATIVPYASFAEGLFKLSEFLTKKPKGYYYFYLGDIDTAGHHYGPDAPETDKMIRHVFEVLEKRLSAHPTILNPKTALVLTADHGQIATYPEKTLYLNQLCPEIIHWMEKDFRGEPIAPVGSPRDYFMHIKKGHVEQAYALLSTCLEGKARVYKTETLIAQGLFGPLPLSMRFLERVGNLVILPYHEESVFWYKQDQFEHCFHGNHGGLSREEMETIFLFQTG